LEKAKSGEPPNPDIASPAFSGVYLDRMRMNGQRLFEVVGIAREDREARRNWMLGMSRFFGAPHLAIVYVDASLSELSLLDVGLALENLMLAAWHFGVGTCPEAAAVLYPQVLRDCLEIPETKRIVLGVALGYPDTSHAVTTYRSLREPSDVLVSWYGFE